MAERRAEYHYVITFSSPKGDIGGVDGTALLAKGSTRNEAYRDIRADALGRLGMPADAVVLFFSLERNALA